MKSTKYKKALEKNKKLISHKDVRIDPFYWMKERDSKDVLGYLHGENKKVEQTLKPVKPLQQKIVKEMKGRLVKDDSSVPVKKGDYYYYTRYRKNQDYPLYCRKKNSLSSKEEIFLDINKLKGKHSYFQVSSISLSPDHSTVSFSVDTKGRRIYNIYFKNLKTQKISKKTISSVTGNHVWALDSQTVFFTDLNKTTLRNDKVYRYDFKKNTKKLIYTEKDPTFYVYLSSSKTRKYIYINSTASESSETRYIESEKPHGEFKLFQKRQKKLEYYPLDTEKGFFVLHNHKSKNFKVSFCPHNKTGLKNWKTYIKHRSEVYIEGVDVFEDFLVLSVKQKGLSELEVISLKTKKTKKLKFKEQTYVVENMGNPDYKSHVFRYSFESLNTPHSIFDYNMKTSKSVLKKKHKVLGAFKSSDYKTERVWAQAHDKTLIPISLVYKKSFKKSKNRPLLLYGYGSYGISMDPHFSSLRLSLLDRGFVYAIAHIRGGSEMGVKWYEKGKKQFKKNTFHDFISCAKHLIQKNYTSSEHLYAYGGSAGGLLMGSVINMRPDLFKGVISAVPFVDCLTTMLDDSIPLTTIEYEEWGNPHEKKVYNYIKSYSPYDNIKNTSYPHLLILSGYHDSQVQYWEPSKWAAKLNKVAENKNLVLLKTNMDAGHSGSSGRFKYLEEPAWMWSFLIGLETKKLKNLTQ